MLEVGFSEILLTLVVALVVLGPERLPDTARTIGKTLGALKKSFSGLQDELQGNENKKQIDDHSSASTKEQ